MSGAELLTAGESPHGITGRSLPEGEIVEAIWWVLRSYGGRHTSGIATEIVAGLADALGLPDGSAARADFIKRATVGEDIPA